MLGYRNLSNLLIEKGIEINMLDDQDFTGKLQATCDISRARR
jgi:hypothetical protein